MKCLSRIEMQEFADKEIPHGTEAEIINHLQNCEKCRVLLEKVEEDKILINNILHKTGIVEKESPIPAFTPPATGRKSVTLWAQLVAAAVIITAVIFLVRNGSTHAAGSIPEAEILLYEYYDGRDLNKMWHEKSQVIILEDENGNVVEPIIIY